MYELKIFNSSSITYFGSNFSLMYVVAVVFKRHLNGTSELRQTVMVDQSRKYLTISCLQKSIMIVGWTSASRAFAFERLFLNPSDSVIVTQKLFVLIPFGVGIMPFK